MSLKYAEIRDKFVFTGGMRPLVIERLDLIEGEDPVEIQVRMCNARHKLHHKLHPTDLWTYDGHYPGKIFVVRKDQSISVEWINEIEGTLPFSVVNSGYIPLDATYVHPENEPGAFDGGTDVLPGLTPCQADEAAKALVAWTVVHLHGAQVAPDSDGWTENAFLPRSIQSASQRSHYPPQPRARMLWYHDHAYTITRLNVFSGLAGGWVIRDPEEDALKLPSGEFELTLIIQDRNFETEGDCLSGKLIHKVETDATKLNSAPGSEPQSDTAEFFGPFTLVNGSLWPSVPVQAQPYRLRVLNGSNARSYQLYLVDDTDTIRNDLIRQIGTDGGLLGDAVCLNSLTYPANDPSFPNYPKGLILAPAERADLIVDFQLAPGRSFRWINFAAAAYDGVPAGDPSLAAGDPKRIDPTMNFNSLNDDQISALMAARLPFPEVMRFVVDDGPPSPALELPTPLSPSFQRLDHDSPELAGHTHRWLALNEKTRGADKQTGFLFFNELIEVEESDPRQVDFTITLAEDSKVHRLLNRQVLFRSPINFYPEADKPEVWHIVNFSADSHPIHLHLVDFQILTRHFYKVAGASDTENIVDLTNPDTGMFPADPTKKNTLIPDPSRVNDPANEDGVDANEAGWKDTVRVNPNEIVTIGMIFKGFTGRFMYHCHILEHEDMDMMRPMTVVPSAVKPFLDEMLNMTSDGPGMSGMPGMPGM